MKPEEAYDQFCKAAALGHSGAQTRQAGCLLGYHGALHPKQDWPEAIRLLRLAAERDSDDGLAMYLLALCHNFGMGVRLDKKKCDELMEKAVQRLDASGALQHGVEAKDVWALFVLARRNHLMKQDYAEAVRLYRRAADLGHAAAISNLGLCYANGEGVEQDHKEAVRLFRQAADL